MRWTHLLLFAAFLGGCLDDDSSDDPLPGDDPTPTASVLFSDGAENGTGSWTYTSNVVLSDFTGTAPVQALDDAHPDGSWVVTTGQAHNGTSAWYSQYPDNYRARMTTTVDVPNGTAVLTYWYKGGAEENTFDGLYLCVDGTQAAYHSGVAALDWTLGAVAMGS